MSKPTGRFASISLWFFDRYKTTLLLWLAICLAGLFSYGVWLSREGFPPIQVPIGAVNGTYFVDDAETVDANIAQPLTDALLADPLVESVQTASDSNFFSAFVWFEEGVDNPMIEQVFEQRLGESVLPVEAQVQFLTFDPARYLNKYDILLSMYSEDEVELANLESAATAVAVEIETAELVKNAEVIPLSTTGFNPSTEQQETRQSAFGRIGVKNSDGSLNYYRSATIGLTGVSSVDVIKLSDQVNQKVSELNESPEYEGLTVVNSADVAPSVTTQINSLQSNVISGLLAVSIISLALITWRASIITALFIVSVVLTTMFVLFLIGVTINTISLFALVLALGLFVDDATIIVEAIDAGKKSKGGARQLVSRAITKVASASFAGTLTTILVFLPLVFVTGILGEFIRILPITIITALIVSLALSLTLIPFLSRLILIPAKSTKLSRINKAETWLAEKLASLPLMLRRNRLKGAVAGVAMIGISLVFIVASFGFASKLDFNIFPASKDSDQLLVEIVYPAGTDIASAEVIAAEVDTKLSSVAGETLESMVYTEANERSASALVKLEPFTTREITSQQILSELDDFSHNYEAAKVRFIQIDPGPPAEEFPFKAQLYSEDIEASSLLAEALQNRLRNSFIERPNGTTARIIATNIEAADTVVRSDGDRFIEVQAAFDSDDTTALVQATQTLIESEFPPSKVLAISGQQVDLQFDFGQESENQDSFSSLAIVGPIAVLAMFILLAIQFRSLWQPLLIFMAIPFSLFGVFYGLYLTNNAISFFSLVGFFGLIGIAVNNTILLTDYANQERRNGLGKLDAISEATKKRFRPLIATSLTTVAALTPLALTDPFWEPLAVTIIFGLLSSTILVVLSFPYYYLIIEVIREAIASYLGKPKRKKHL